MFWCWGKSVWDHWEWANEAIWFSQGVSHSENFLITTFHCWIGRYTRLIPQLEDWYQKIVKRSKLHFSATSKESISDDFLTWNPGCGWATARHHRDARHRLPCQPAQLGMVTSLSSCYYYYNLFILCAQFVQMPIIIFHVVFCVDIRFSYIFRSPQ